MKTFIFYLENAVPRMELFSHFPDFLNTSKRALPRSPEAPVMRTEQPFGSEICDAAIATIHTDCIIFLLYLVMPWNN